MLKKFKTKKDFDSAMKLIDFIELNFNGMFISSGKNW